MIHPVGAHPGCRRCPPFGAAQARRDAQLQEIGVWRELHEVAADWQPCAFIADWRWQVVAKEL